MSDLAIVTDSTSDLPPELLTRHDITAIPLCVEVGGRSYRDRIDLTPDEFYVLLAKDNTSSRTSQPSLGIFLETYRRLLDAGKKIVSIHISSRFSGTGATADMARRQLIDQGAREDDITVFDSLNASMGLGWQVLAAAEAAGEGQRLPEILQLLERVRERVRLYLHCPTLEYLHRGGRIGAVSALLGSLLNIVPLLTVVNGSVVAAAKLRGEGQVLRRYLELVGEAWSSAQTAHTRLRLSVMHAHALEQAKALRQRLVETLGLTEVPLLVETGPVVGGHVGPGSLGVSFFS